MRVMLVCLILALSGCASTSGDAELAAPPAAAPETTTDARDEPRRTPDQVPAGAVAIPASGVGEPQVSSDGRVWVEVDAIRPTISAPVASAGAWAAARVRVCNVDEPGAAPTHVSWRPWSAVGSDGLLYPAPSQAVENFPAPHYPFLRVAFGPGDCAQGWIPFQAPTGVEVLGIRYAPCSCAPIAWALDPASKLVVRR